MSISTVLFDFDGVLSQGRFYKSQLLPAHADLYETIQVSLFGNKTLVHDWMRGRIGYRDIHRRLEEEGIGQTAIFLNTALEESVRHMALDERVLALAQTLKTSGKKIGLVTDNMDIFSQVTVGCHGLDRIFDLIANSADEGMLKNDQEGLLFDRVLKRMGESSYGSVVMIDDSAGTIDLFSRKGGVGFLYKDFETLQEWVRAI